MTNHIPNRGIATMIDPPDESRARAIVIPKVRTDQDFVFLLVTRADDADEGPIPAFRSPAVRDLRPNDGIRRWR